MRFINGIDTIETTSDLEYDAYKDIYVWGWNGEGFGHRADGTHDGFYTIDGDERTAWTIEGEE